MKKDKYYLQYELNGNPCNIEFEACTKSRARKLAQSLASNEDIECYEIVYKSETGRYNKLIQFSVRN